MHSSLKLCIAVVVLGLAVDLSESVPANETRIVGGVKTTINTAPYTVQVLFADEFSCGGTILTPTWVLTAAHCVYNRDSAPSFFKVRGGSTILSGGVVRMVEKIFKHPLYNSTTLFYDAAMLKLRAPLNGPNIQRIGLCSATPPTNASVKVSGWGLTSEGGSISNQLKSVILPVMDTETCKTMYDPDPIETVICAAQKGMDACSGDSGGPLVYKNQLCGIVSWGNGCAAPNHPGVYTDIPKVTRFINRIMANN